MESQPLAPVYLDNEPVGLMGDPRPHVSKVMAASGRSLEHVDILLLEDRDATGGIPVELGDVIDRTERPTRAIYLTTVEREETLEQDAPEGAGSLAARIGSGSGGGSQFGQGNGPPLELGPGVSGEGNEAGSPQSAYSRTGTDTAQPGMAEQEARAAGFGSGAGKGTSSGARESGKSASEDGRSRMAAGLEDPFGREGLGKTPPAPAATEPEDTQPEPSGLGASRPVRVIGRSGTASEPKVEAEDSATEPEELDSR